jgi:hypothetical protein
MKIGGVEIKGPNMEVLVLPRLEEDIVVKAKAVTSFNEFDNLVPEPKPPGIRTKDGWKPNPNDETYRQRIEHYNNQRLAYLIIIALEPSEIGWARVNIEDPSTYLEWDKELREAGLSDVEINRIVMCVMQANALDEDKLKVAREVFLHGRAEGLNESSGQNIEPLNTPYGEDANELESAHQE